MHRYNSIPNVFNIKNNAMKTSIKYILIISISLFLSCSSDDDGDSDPDNTSAPLAGAWVPESYMLTGSVVLATNEINERTLISGSGSEFGATLAFSENPNNYAFSGNFRLLFITTDPAGEETQEVIDAMLSESGTWEQNGNRINFTTDLGDNLQASVQELSESSLRFTRILNDVETMGDTIITTNLNESYIFSRRGN